MGDQKIVPTHDIISFTIKRSCPSGWRGYLEKRGHLMKNWRKRYFVLSSAGDFKYYVDETCTQLQGSYLIRSNSIVSITDEFAGRQNILTLEAEKLDGKKLETLHVSAESTNDRQNWLVALNEVIHDGYQLINIPELWNVTFYPSLSIRVTFGGHNTSLTVVEDGNTVPSAHLNMRPSIQFLGASGDTGNGHYAMLMVSVGEVCGTAYRRFHWAVANRSPANADAGTEMVSYVPPTELEHHAGQYFILVFRQAAVLSPDQLETARAAAVRLQKGDFSTVDWARELLMGSSSPVAVEWFRVATPEHVDNLVSSQQHNENIEEAIDGNTVSPVAKNDIVDNAGNEEPLTISIPSTTAAADSITSGSNVASHNSTTVDSGGTNNGNSNNMSSSSGSIDKPRSPSKSVGFKSSSGDSGAKVGIISVVGPSATVEVNDAHSPVSTLTSGSSSDHSLFSTNSPQKIDPALSSSLSFDSPAAPSKRGNAVSSFSIKSALKKSSAFPIAQAHTDAVATSSASSMSSSPLGGNARKKLGVSFMIVNPRLQSDTAHVNASFYEGIHLPPSREEEEEEEEEGDAGFDDVPDYQVSSYDNGGPGIMRTAKDRADGDKGASSNTDAKQQPTPVVLFSASPATSSTASGSTLATEVLSSSASVAAAPQRTNSVNSNSATIVESQPHTNAPPVALRRASSDSNTNGVSGSRSSLVPLMERVSAARTPKEFCTVFGINTAEVFEGELMRKKFSRDLVMKESFVWVEPASKSIHWAKSATQKSIKHKHILLDKHSTYNVLSSSSTDADTAAATAVPASSSVDSVTEAKLQSYKRTASGAYAGTIRGAELEDLTITINTQTDQRLKIKIPPGNGGAAATQRAKDWFRVIKLLTQDTAN